MAIALSSGLSLSHPQPQQQKNSMAGQHGQYGPLFYTNMRAPSIPSAGYSALLDGLAAPSTSSDPLPRPITTR